MVFVAQRWGFLWRQVYLPESSWSVLGAKLWLPLSLYDHWCPFTFCVLILLFKCFCIHSSDLRKVRRKIFALPKLWSRIVALVTKITRRWPANFAFQNIFAKSCVDVPGGDEVGGNKLDKAWLWSGLGLYTVTTLLSCLAVDWDRS